jgi:chromosome segregation ATPase
MTSRLVELDAIKAEISSLESAREAAVTSKEELVEGYIKLHGESTCLKSALETIPQLTADVEKWKAQSGEAERELKRCKRDREEDGSRIKALEGSVRGLVSERDRLTSDKTTLEASKAAETTSREAAEALAMEKVEKVDRLQASLEHARANAATATEPLDTEVKSLKAENAKLIEQSENLARANRTLEQELEKLRSGQASALRSSIAPSATAGAIGAQAPAAVSKSRGDLGRPKTPPSKSLSIPMRTEPPTGKDPFHS